MSIWKWAAAVVITGFAALPASAGERAGQSGETIFSQGKHVSTAACDYGYAKSRKTGKCILLVCKKTHMLDKNGHKCIRKPKKRVYRGSH